MEREMAMVIDALDAEMVANRQKATELASRFAAVGERMVEARKTSAPDLERIEAGREVLKLLVAGTDNDRSASLMFGELFAVDRYATRHADSTAGQPEVEFARFYTARRVNHQRATELASRFAAVSERMAERGGDVAREVLEVLVAIMGNWREASLLAAGYGEGLGADPTAALFEGGLRDECPTGPRPREAGGQGRGRICAGPTCASSSMES